MSIFAHIFSTEYSNEEAFGNVNDYINTLLDQVKESGETEPALILADKFSTAAQVPFFKACLDKGIKPVFGLKVTVQGNENNGNHDLILVAKNEAGRQNLHMITTEAYNETKEKGYKLITREQLEEFKDGIICISGGRKGLIEQELISGNYKKAASVARYLQKVFNTDFYLQVQRTSIDVDGQALEKTIFDGMKQISQENNIKIVASNDVRINKKENFKFHLLRKAIIEKELLYNPSKNIEETEEQYLKPTAQMIELFKDYPEAVFNMGDLVDSTNILDFKNRLGKSYLPKFPIPEEFNEDPVLYLTHITQQGFEKRWEKIERKFRERMGSATDKGDIITEDYITKTKKEYQERIDYELETIKKTGFAGYFLIVQELVNWCKDNDIPVGPGRGSGAGSLVLFSLNITDIDPIPYDLLFERFLNPERLSEPDIDIDFSTRQRNRVIAHMKDLYGAENTAQILTEGTMAAKSAIDSVGAARGLTPEERNNIKDLIDTGPEVTLKAELEVNEKLREKYETSRQARVIIQEALKMEGAIKSYGKHAGGVVISLGKMSQYASIQRVQDDEGNAAAVVQLNKDLCEKVGLIKFDILGISNLDIIQDCVALINKDRKDEDKLHIQDVDLKDTKTINLFKAADTYSVFQFFSPGMRRLMKDLSPDNFEEIVALVALFRPGPLQSNMHTDFIERKFNPEKLVYMHPRLETKLAPTKGTVIYQEQVMGIASELAGYSLGKADILRKAMGKKDAALMVQQRGMFLSGCFDNFREETLNNSRAKLKASYDPSKTIAVDIIMNNLKSENLHNIVKDSEFKFLKVDQLIEVLKGYAGMTEDESKIFKLEADNLDEKTFFRRYHQKLLTIGVENLKKEGLSHEDSVDEMNRISAAAYNFSKYNKIFTLMEKFAAYGFNKSHSVAYAYLAFQTAYLKAHYPAQYMAAVLTNDKDIADLEITLQETRRMGINVLKPDINMSLAHFHTPTNDEKEKNVIFGLEKIKGINKSVSHIIKIREEKGPIKNIFDFYDKCGSYKIKDEVELIDGTIKSSQKTLIGKTVLNNLINSGAFDSICPNKDPKHRAMLQATYLYLEDAVGDIKKKLNHNFTDMKKKIEKQDNSRQLMDMLNSNKEILVPEIISEMNHVKINEIYNLVNSHIEKVATKKTEMLNLKPISSYEDELNNFNTDVKKVQFEQDGKTLTYIEPNSVNYAVVPEYNTIQSVVKEHEMTGMYQTKTPLDLNNIKNILIEKSIRTSNAIDLPQEIDTFGLTNERTGRKNYQCEFAGTILSVRDFKKFDNNSGEAYMQVSLILEDSTGTVNVMFNASKMFSSGNELKGIDMLKNMIKKDVLVISGSASNGLYESAGVTIFPKKIGSTNSEIYLPLLDPSLNFVSNENENIVKSKQSQDLATTAQIGKLELLLKRNSVSYKEIFDKYSIENISELKKHEASSLIQKYMDNKQSPR